MSDVPQMILRLGTHAEKEYVTKLTPFLDGLILGANLFEATSGATASLLLKLGAKDTRLFLDPMTYAFGTYIDPKNGKVRSDLDWIKSDQIVKQKGSKTKKTVRDYKRSYRRLADTIGFPLQDALNRDRAVDENDLSTEESLKTFCRSVLEYQRDRIVNEFRQDDYLDEFADNAPTPDVVFSPYFYIVPTQTESWLELNLRMISASGDMDVGSDVHAIVCADRTHLSDSAFIDDLAAGILGSSVSGAWLWFSRFDELKASEAELKSFRVLVSRLSEKIEVYNLHGGFFSLALSKYGMAGISHGVGYGEQKDVVPVIGQSTPTVRYYHPALQKRLGVPEIERCFDAMGVKTAADFHSYVCGCAVCKGVVAKSLKRFSEFGERKKAVGSKRSSQTAAAAKRCRFHFLLNRIAERDYVRKSTLDNILKTINTAAKEWGAQPSLSPNAAHLGRWARALSPDSND